MSAFAVLPRPDGFARAPFANALLGETSLDALLAEALFADVSLVETTSADLVLAETSFADSSLADALFAEASFGDALALGLPAGLPVGLPSSGGVGFVESRLACPVRQKHLRHWHWRLGGPATSQTDPHMHMHMQTHTWVCRAHQ